MKWEYAILSIDEFNERIKSGIANSDWELVAIYKDNAYFKRCSLKSSESTKLYKCAAIEGYFGGEVG